jgi:hypothetical protein
VTWRETPGRAFGMRVCVLPRARISGHTCPKGTARARRIASHSKLSCLLGQLNGKHDSADPFLHHPFIFLNHEETGRPQLDECMKLNALPPPPDIAPGIPHVIRSNPPIGDYHQQDSRRVADTRGGKESKPISKRGRPPYISCHGGSALAVVSSHVYGSWRCAWHWARLPLAGLGLPLPSTSSSRPPTSRPPPLDRAVCRARHGCPHLTGVAAAGRLG